MDERKLDMAKMILAMEFIARHINDEDIFLEWIAYGVADEDIPYGSFETADVDSYYLRLDVFEEIKDTFISIMARIEKEKLKDA